MQNQSDVRRRFTVWLAAVALVLAGDFAGFEGLSLAGIALLAAQVGAILVRGSITDWPGMGRGEAALTITITVCVLMAGLLASSEMLVLTLALAIVAVAFAWYLAAKLLHALSRRLSS